MIKIKRFRGISIDIFKINLGKMIGFNFSFFTVGILISKGLTIHYKRSFLFLGFVNDFENSGFITNLKIGVLFFKPVTILKIIIRYPTYECDNCYTTFQHGFVKDNHNIFCSYQCKDEF